MGIRTSERRVRTLAGTTEKDGTSPDGILIAARELGACAAQYSTSDRTAAWGWFVDCIRTGRPVIISVSAGQHWRAAVGMVGDRVLVVDPTNAEQNKRENGTAVLSKPEFMRRWRHHTDGWFGISIGKK